MAALTGGRRQAGTARQAGGEERERGAETSAACLAVPARPQRARRETVPWLALRGALRGRRTARRERESQTDSNGCASPKCTLAALAFKLRLGSEERGTLRLSACASPLRGGLPARRLLLRFARRGRLSGSACASPDSPVPAGWLCRNRQGSTTSRLKVLNESTSQRPRRVGESASRRVGDSTPTASLGDSTPSRR